MGENADKLRFKCTNLKSSMRVTVYAECINVFFSQNLVHITEYHVDC